MALSLNHPRKPESRATVAATPGVPFAVGIAAGYFARERGAQLTTAPVWGVSPHATRRFKPIVVASDVAEFYAVLGDRAKAMEWLDRAGLRPRYGVFPSPEISAASVRLYWSSAAENALRYPSSESFWPFQSPSNAVRLPSPSYVSNT